MRPVPRVVAIVARGLLVAVLTVLLVVGAGFAALETSWGRNQLRALIVRQANPYLTATLTIDSLGGSLIRGLQLTGVTLAQDGRSIVHIDEVDVRYSLRELVRGGTTIRRIRLVRPQVVAARQADGRWNLGSLVKRNTRDEERTGPGRPLFIQSISVVDGQVHVLEPLAFGAAHVPTSFTSLNGTLAFAYQPVKWTLTFADLSWTGREPTLDVTRIAGAVGQSGDGWFFNHLRVETPRSSFALDGRVERGDRPTALDLQVHADRFAFTEWAGVLPGLDAIAVEARFDVALTGPLAALDTAIHLSGSGGSVDGQVRLDTSVPGWHARGAVDVDGINLAHWLSRPDRPSNVAGHAAFDLDLELGRHLPRGTYTFTGPRAEFMGYAAERVTASGRLTAREVVIDRAEAAAYGGAVRATAGTIGVDAPFAYRFQGSATGVDLRLVPGAVPVPHVDTSLAFDYDVSGRFEQPFITGHAAFGPSEFMGARVGPGTVGTIDTSGSRVRFTGDGEVDDADLTRIGRGLGVAWMREPRYAGTVSGRFHVAGDGTTPATLALQSGGHVSRAHLFGGTIADADVVLTIDQGTLAASFDGGFAGVNPATASDDPRLDGAVTGTAAITATINDLLTRDPVLTDYAVAGSIALHSSRLRGVTIDTAVLDGALRDGSLTLTRMDLTGPAVAAHAEGVVALEDSGNTDVQYDIARADIAQLADVLGPVGSGVASSTGRLTGRRVALTAVGDGTIRDLDISGVQAQTLAAHYEATIPQDRTRLQATVSGDGASLTVLGQPVQRATGSATMDGDRLGFDVQVQQAGARRGSLAGTTIVHRDRRELELLDLSITLGDAPWRMASTQPAPVLSWSDAGVGVTPLAFVGGGSQAGRITVAGTWREDGHGALHLGAAGVALDSVQGAFAHPLHYGGQADLDAVVSGTRAAPIVTGTLTINHGQVDRLSYEKLAARLSYAGGMFTLDARLDQGPGTWLTAVGTIPRALFARDLPERPLNLAIVSSPINLGLLEGLTDVVRDVTGQIRLDVHAVGTSRDPHITGSIGISAAGFLVATTGTRYKNLAASLRLTTESIVVDTMHVEDTNGDALDAHGSLGTHEMRVGDLQIDATAKHFEVFHNELGRVDADATLQIRGRLDAPKLSGQITLGGEAKVDRILERTIRGPYSTEAMAPRAADAVAVLNPWDRLALDLTVHVPESFKLTGQNVQVSQGTPIGLGDINLRAGGDVYLYKDAGQPLSLTGSLYSLAGSYMFQGRRFELDPNASSINFQGDLNPGLFITVVRVISGIETRVTIAGTLQAPELRLASVPPLDQSDILSLIVFNTTPNQLSAPQQQELAVRAGALAAGFLASSLMSAIQNEIGLDVLEFEPSGDAGGGPTVTLGQELAPGVIARFSRQFGSDAHDEVTIEYYLSRILRLRATFSDAQTLNSGAQFRRVERAGIDLLFFFSF